jgi:hypothetical protein
VKWKVFEDNQKDSCNAALILSADPNIVVEITLLIDTPSETPVLPKQ